MPGPRSSTETLTSSPLRQARGYADGLERLVQDLRVAEDRRDRRLQLVRHQPQELILHRERFLQFRQRALLVVDVDVRSEPAGDIAFVIAQRGQSPQEP